LFAEKNVTFSTSHTTHVNCTKINAAFAARQEKQVTRYYFNPWCAAKSLHGERLLKPMSLPLTIRHHEIHQKTLYRRWQSVY
jgi:hypothetical protein